MNRSELFDPVLHSYLDDLVFVTKQRLVMGGVVRREVLSKLQNTELMKLFDWCSDDWYWCWSWIPFIWYLTQMFSDLLHCYLCLTIYGCIDVISNQDEWNETLPNAQRTQGLSSYHKFSHKSWSNFIFKSRSGINFKISTKHEHLD